MNKWLPPIIRFFLETDHVPEEDMISIPLSGHREVVLIRPTGVLYRDTFLLRYQSKKQTDEAYTLSTRLPRTPSSIRDVIAFLQRQELSPTLQRQTYATFDHRHRLQQQQQSMVPRPLPSWWTQMDRLEKDFFRNEYHIVAIEGIANATMMRYLHPSSNQYVLILGEDHDEDGNFVQFLQGLLQTGSCPVDMIVEKEYKRSMARYAGSQVFSHRHWKSNKSHLYYLRQDLEQCTAPTVKTSQLLSRGHRHFVEQCILPFQGRVKFWSEDLRFTQDFIFLQFLSVDLDDETTALQQQYRREFFERLTDYRLYAEHRDQYMASMQAFLERVQDLVSQIFERVEFEEHTTEQRWRHFFEDLPLAKVREWMEMIARSDDQYRARFAALFDIPACERVLRLLREDKNRMIVVFTGAKHTSKLVQMLTSDRLYAVKTYRSPSRLSIPSITVSEPTPWMELYQKILHKK